MIDPCQDVGATRLTMLNDKVMTTKMHMKALRGHSLSGK